MSVRSALAFAITLLAIPVVTQVQAQTVVEEHGRWTSHVSREEHEFRFRAVTTAVYEDARVVLAFDRFAGVCETLYPSMSIQLPRPSTESVAIMDDVSFVRTDEHPIRTMRFNAWLHEGDAVVYLEVTRILGNGALFAELRRGRTVRFKLGTARQTYYVGFPLDGFSAATDRTLALCRENEAHLRQTVPPRQPRPRGTEDRDYFEEPDPSY
jgi:invasion protein IalB